MSGTASAECKPWDLPKKHRGLRRRTTTSWREVIRARVVSVATEVDVVRCTTTTLATTECEHEVLVRGAEAHLEEAWDATVKAPLRRRVIDWWSGASIERAWLHLDEADALLARMMPMDALAARKPAIQAIADQCFDRDDPRRLSTDSWMRASATVEPETQRAQIVTTLRWARSATQDRLDGLRNFRNLVLAASVALLALAVGLALLGAKEPTMLPLCFVPQEVTTSTSVPETPVRQACPTGERTATVDDAPQPGDVVLVELLGFVGGALAAAVAIHRIRGTKTPYDVPVALAVLKLPFGALTALAALLLVHGAFLPGLSNLDSQAQIVAYALVFGYSQQAITRLIDRQGQSVLDSVPSSEVTGTSPFTPPPLNNGAV